MKNRKFKANLIITEEVMPTIYSSLFSTLSSKPSDKLIAVEKFLNEDGKTRYRMWVDTQQSGRIEISVILADYVWTYGFLEKLYNSYSRVEELRELVQ